MTTLTTTNTIFPYTTLFRSPNAKIIAFEPEQKNFDLLKLNARPYKNIKAYKKGISNIHCKMNIIDIGDGEASYQLQSESTYRSEEHSLNSSHPSISYAVFCL